MKYGILMLTLALAGTLYAQSTAPGPIPGPIAAPTYTVTSGASTGYADLTGGTNLGLSYGTNSLISPTGFSFHYFGTTYTSVRVYASGYIVMGSAFGTVSKPVNHTTGVGTFVSPLWGDYNPAVALGMAASMGQVNYRYSNSVLTVEWKNIPSSANTSFGVRMQALLDTSTGQIEFRYASPQGGSGYTNNTANACAISSPNTTGQEVVPGTDAGFISSTGAVTAYPGGRWVRFTPPTVSVPNTAPALVVKAGSTTIANGATLNVSHGTTVSGTAFQVEASDVDADNISITATITNLGATGIVLSEWNVASAPGPHSLAPASGSFNTLSGATHLFTITAGDGVADTTISFTVVQAVAAPLLTVSDSNGSITNGAPAAGTLRDYGSQNVSSGATSPVTITINNGGGSAMTLSAFAITSTDFVLDTTLTQLTVNAGSNTTFSVAFDPTSTGVKSANVSFNHTGGSFSFEVTGVGTVPLTAQLMVRAGGSGGTAVNSGYNHDFGTLALTSLPTADYVFYIYNAGTADLTITNLMVAGHVSAGMTAPITLTPGNGTNLGVSFNAAASGVYNGSVTFAHNDASVTAPFTLQFTGTVAGTGGGPTGTLGGVSGGGGGGGCAATHGTLAGLLAMLALAAIGLKRRREA